MRRDDYFTPKGLVRHTLTEPPNLVKTDSVYDIGAGIRPQTWFIAKEHTLVEPSVIYAERLTDAGWTVVCARAEDFLESAEPRETIFLLDVIEHMDKDTGLKVIDLMKAVATRQIVVYTPFGFMEQNEDAWGMGEHDLQTHRSGWYPEDFPGFVTHRHSHGFFAVLTK